MALVFWTLIRVSVMKSFAPLRLLAAALAVALLAPLSLRAAPADELLRLVPDDAGFCLVVRDLRGHSKALLGSPFAQRFRESAVGKSLLAQPEWKKLEAVEQQLQKHFGAGWERLRDDVLGDAVVLAYRPGPPGKPEQEQDLVLVHARDPKLLADLVSRIHEAQKRSGELKGLEARTHKGQTYWQRTEAKKTNYAYLHGPLLAVSSQEEVLRRAIERHLEPGGQEPAAARQMRRLGADKALATLWINPRPFEADIAAKAERAKGDEAAVLRNFVRWWKALDAVGLSLNVTDRLELTLTVLARPEQLSPAARRFLAEAGKPSELWQRFPDNALLAAAARIDAAALYELLGDFLTPDSRQSLRNALEQNFGAALGKKDVIRTVLPHLGPDVGLCVLAPPQDKASRERQPPEAWFPHAVLACKVGPAGRVDEATLSAAQFYAQLAVFAHNRHHDDAITIEKERQGDVEVRYLVNDRRFPPGFRPAFALQGGYLTLASSPEALRRFAALPSRPISSTGEVPLLRMSLKNLRQFLADRHDALAAAVAEQNKLPKEEAAKQLRRLAEALAPLDRLELACRSESGRASLALRVRTAWPLRK